MASIKRTAAAIAAILVRDGVDYAQSKAVFKAARERAGLRAAPEHRGGVDRLTVEEGVTTRFVQNRTLSQIPVIERPFANEGM